MLCFNSASFLMCGICHMLWKVWDVSKRGRLGVEAMFQEFVSFMSGSLILCLMRPPFFFVFCVLSHVMCVVCDHVGCIVFGLLSCFYVCTIFVGSLSILFLLVSTDGVGVVLLLFAFHSLVTLFLFFVLCGAQMVVRSI